jgi:XTP/dITP diphosphohydrolase
VSHPELARLIRVMAVLRHRCPWDAQQTHRSLVQYLVEESLEVVEAIESGGRDDLCEELGDLLLQVVFHAEIAGESAGGFDLEDVAKGIADKLIARHPHVFDPLIGSEAAPAPTDEEVLADLNATWEHRKAVEKGRTSVLEGIPDQLSAMAKAAKIIGRARSRAVDLPLGAAPIEPADLGSQVLELVARAQAHGIDPEQAVRDAVRQLEAMVGEAEVRSRA